MLKRLAAAMLLLWSSTAGLAAEWWCVAISAGGAPNRILGYVDLDTTRPGGSGAIEVWGLTVFESPLANGERFRQVHYAFNCQHQRVATISGVSYDSEMKAIPNLEVPAIPYRSADANSIEDLTMRMACRMPTNRGIPVAEPMQHAATYLREHTFAGATDAPEGGAAGAQGAGAAGAGDAGAGDAGGAQEQGDQQSMSFGTAFFVGPGGYALTAYHVVDGADRIACRSADGTVREMTVARVNQANDIVLLRANFRPTRYLGLAPRGSLRAGERVFTIGYGAPSFLGINEPRFTEGVISALSGVEANDAEVQNTVPIQPGNSGGPLVNEAGQLVGIVTASAAPDAFQREVGATPQSINWAVKADYAAPLLPSLPPVRAMTRAQAIALTHDSVCFVMALHRADDGRQ